MKIRKSLDRFLLQSGDKRITMQVFNINIFGMGQGILESNKRWFNQTSCIDKSYLAHYPGQAPHANKKSTLKKIPYILGNGTFLL